MKKTCFCGLVHADYKSDEHALLSTAYHDLSQGAKPDKEWMEAVFELLTNKEACVCIVSMCTACDGLGTKYITLYDTWANCSKCKGTGVVVE